MFKDIMFSNHTVIIALITKYLLFTDKLKSMLIPSLASSTEYLNS